MDRTSRNWDVLKELHFHLSDKRYSHICNTGSCGLHVAHEAFETKMKLRGWKIDQVFRAIFGLLYKSPIRRGVYVRVGETDILPIS